MSKISSILKMSLLSCILLFLDGCATIFGDNVKTVKVNSQPQGAEIFMNSMPVGTTPLLVTVPSTWSTTMLTLKKRGYADQYAQINTAFQPIGLLNILFPGPIIGFGVDAMAGNIKKIAPESRMI